ncbi:exopolysaccharide biosynthesis protein, partial [bacterium]|nr:exopolysaccharide biosynthesis protein [bacterium]
VCPVPGVIPFTNSLPSYAIIAIAAGVMEEDGICLSLGYILFLATCVYFGLIAGSIITLLNRYYDDIFSWLQQLI